MKYIKPVYEKENVDACDNILASPVQIKYFDTPEGKKAEMSVDYGTLFGTR